MKREWRKWLMTGLAATVIAAGSSACGWNPPQTHDATPSTAPSAPSASAQLGGDLQILTWANQATLDALTEINRRFESVEPGIRAEVQVIPSIDYMECLKTRLTSGNVDLFSNQVNLLAALPGSGLPEPEPPVWQSWMDQGILADLTDEPFTRLYTDFALSHSARNNGRLYSVCTGMVAFNLVYYNRAIFEREQLLPPHTWEEYMHLCSTLLERGIPPMTGAGKDKWPIAAASEGVLAGFMPDMEKQASAFGKGQRSYTDEASASIWSALWEWTSYFEPRSLMLDYGNVIARFTSGEVAMMPEGMWQYSNIVKEAPDFPLDFFVLPYPEANGPAALTGKFDLNWMAVNGPDKELAMAWLAHFSAKEQYEVYINTVGFLPTQSNINLSHPLLKALSPMLSRFRPAYELVWRSPEKSGPLAGFGIKEFRSMGGTSESWRACAEAAQRDLEKGLP